MKIGIISNHHFSLPSINYLASNGLVAGFAVPEIQNQNFQNVKQVSEALRLPFKTLQKKNLAGEIESWLAAINPDIVFIFSFPYRIPEPVINIPKHGFINFHPSILPAYRGPDPLFWQIKNGEKESGVTAHRIDGNFDSGPILHVESENIATFDNYGFLENKFAITLLKCVGRVLNLILGSNNGLLPNKEQDEKIASYFGRPGENDLMINWYKQDAESICNLVKASNPKYQGAVTFYKNVPVRILQVSIESGGTTTAQAGTIINTNDGIKTAASDNKILSLEIIYVMEGCFTGASFQKLFGLKIGDKFGLV